MWYLKDVDNNTSSPNTVSVRRFMMRNLVIFLATLYLVFDLEHLWWNFKRGMEVRTNACILNVETGWGYNRCLETAQEDMSYDYEGVEAPHTVITFITLTTFLGLPLLLLIQLMFAYQVVIKGNQNLWSAQRTAWCMFLSACYWIVS